MSKKVQVRVNLRGLSTPRCDYRSRANVFSSQKHIGSTKRVEMEKSTHLLSRCRQFLLKALILTKQFLIFFLEGLKSCDQVVDQHVHLCSRHD